MKMRRKRESKVKHFYKEYDRKMKKEAYEAASKSKLKDYTNFTVDKHSNTDSSEKNLTSEFLENKFEEKKRTKQEEISGKLNSIRKGRLEVEDPDDILSGEFPFNQMNLSARDGVLPQVEQSFRSPNKSMTIRIETIREFIKSKITDVYKMPDLDAKMK